MVDEISSVLRRVGLVEGDIVLIYSNLASVSKIIDVRQFPLPTLRQRMLNEFHSAVLKVIGDRGTVATLGSYTDYARYGLPFYVDKSLPDQSLGAYPRHLFTQSGCVRSFNPTSNLLALGPKASLISVRNNATAYGFGTPWEQLIKNQAKILFWDTTLRPMTFGHHVEQCVGVPYVYSKLYDTPIYLNGVLVPFPTITSVRYLDYGVRYNMSTLEVDAKKNGLVQSVIENGLSVDLIQCNSFSEFLADKLIKNPYYMLDEPPSFVRGRVPFDGNPGPENIELSNVKY